MNTFLCECCKKQFPFEPGWSDEKALKEAELLYGGPIPEDERAVVCDPCFAKIMASRARMNGTGN